MYLSRLWPDTRQRHVRRDLADCQDLHRTLLSAFPDGAAAAGARAEYGVLYRVEPARPGQPLTVLVQSAIQPDWTRLPDAYLLADAPGDNPACRPLAPFWDQLAPGQELRFRLRANPTRKVDTKTGADGRRRNGRRVSLTAEADQIAWLVRKAESGGFELAHTQIRPDGPPDVLIIPEDKLIGQRRDGRIAADGRDRLTFGSVLFEGKLRITDREVFRSTLEHGIGSGKAYGFGLLSIARLPI